MAMACPCGRGEAVGADEVVARSGEAVETEACVRAVHGRPRCSALYGQVEQVPESVPLQQIIVFGMGTCNNF